jgi:acyl-CoA reductase-like NAD-dependent aldehyde dehydrogenase
LFSRLQELIRRDQKKLAENITKEQGKTLPDSEGDVYRGLQVIGKNLVIPLMVILLR